MSDPVIVAALGTLGLVLSAWVNTRKTRQKVTEVAAQMHPNGGSSLRDALNRIESRLDVVHRSQVATTERLDRHIEGCGG